MLNVKKYDKGQFKTGDLVYLKQSIFSLFPLLVRRVVDLFCRVLIPLEKASICVWGYIPNTIQHENTSKINNFLGKKVNVSLF